MINCACTVVCLVQTLAKAQVLLSSVKIRAKYPGCRIQNQVGWNLSLLLYATKNALMLKQTYGICIYLRRCMHDTKSQESLLSQ